MTHESQVRFSGDGRQAVQIAFDALTAAGMRINSKTATTIEFKGPGLNNTRDNPLRGISSGRLHITGSSIHLTADLGAVSRLFKILGVMIFGLDLVGAVILYIFLRGKFSLPLVLAIAVGPVAPWIVLLPWMANWMKRRTIGAMDTLLNNLAVGAGTESQRTLPKNSSVS
jgi:hypothetical protein